MALLRQPLPNELSDETPEKIGGHLLSHGISAMVSVYRPSVGTVMTSPGFAVSVPDEGPPALLIETDAPEADVTTALAEYVDIPTPYERAVTYLKQVRAEITAKPQEQWTEAERFQMAVITVLKQIQVD